MLGNLFGTKKRVEFIFRDALEHVRRVIELKIDPMAALKIRSVIGLTHRTALTMCPRV